MTVFATRLRQLRVTALWVLGLWLLLPAIVGAAEAGGWRPTYDLVMRWLNFLILVFVIVKYSRRPLANFLKGRQKEIGAEIEQIEQEKETINKAAVEARRNLEESARRLEELQQRIIERGEKRKLEIIAEARQEGRHIMESARRKVEGTLLQAKNKVREEMIDKAVAIALEKLPTEITARDNEKLFTQFLASADRE